MWVSLDNQHQMWYTVGIMNLIKRTILKAFKDEDFAQEILGIAMHPDVLELNPEKKYILLLDTPVDKKTEDAFVRKLQGYDIVLLTGAKGQLLELTMEEL